MDQAHNDSAAGMIGWWVVIIMAVLVCRSWATGLDSHQGPDRLTTTHSQMEPHVASSADVGEAMSLRLVD